MKVAVAGSDLTIDYTDMPPQVEGRINSGRHGGGMTTARVALMYLIARGEPANEGTFRPLKLILPDGKMVSADATAPMGALRLSVSDHHRHDHQGAGAGDAPSR